MINCTVLYFLLLQLMISVTEAQQNMCTPDLLPRLFLQGLCLSMNLLESCPRGFELSMSKDCAQFAWCCYDPRAAQQLINDSYNADQYGDDQKKLYTEYGCGKSAILPTLSSTNKITGGWEAVPHSWPWQVAMMFTVASESYYCGGNVISDRWILTAARCCFFAATEVRAVVGAHNLLKNNLELSARTMSIKKMFQHPQYNSSNLDYDLCLLKTQELIIFSREIMPICLPWQADTFLEAPGTECFITGFGATSVQNAPILTQLVQASMQIVSTDYCKLAYTREYLHFQDGFAAEILSSMICAKKQGHSPCQGDSGGPLACRNPVSDAYVLIGVDSWGMRCTSADTGLPSVFARVSSSKDWIINTMNLN